MAFTYNEQELGWKTEPFIPKETVFLEIKLKKRGRVVVKQGFEPKGEFPKILVTPVTDGEFQFVLKGDLSKNPLVYIVTSEEPEYINYVGEIDAYSGSYLDVDKQSVWVTGSAEAYFNISSNVIWSIK